jgi:5-hydroxyisourate hydrolase-like protein (transthyretin family)
VAAAQRTDKSVIDGVVLRAGTDEPLFRATVRLISLRDGIPSSTKVSVTTTDSRGRFVLTDLDAGDYRLMFAINGYVAHEYGQRVLHGRGTPLKLPTAQPLNGIVVRLTPTGSVSGRILDRSGKPLGNVPVQLMREQYRFNGSYEKQLSEETDARTNDRGEYRLFFVTPGRYLLTAGTPPNSSSFEDFNSAAGNDFREDVAFSYYPGALDATSASMLNVRSGEELSGMDMIVNPPRTYSVRGRVIDGRTGTPPATVQLSLVARPGERSRDRTSYTASTGVFEFREVPEGLYTAVAATVPARTFSGREMPSPSAETAGSVRLDVGGANLEGVVLTLESGVPLSGRVRVEGVAADAKALDLASLRVWLMPSPDSIPAVTTVRLLPESTVDATGTFRFNHVWDASYRFQVLRLPEDWYVKQASLGEQDLLNNSLRITTAPQNTLDVVVSPNTAEIQVAALDTNSKPVSGAQIVLIPTARERVDLFNFESADMTGRVTLRRVVPGDYTLIAWEAIEDLSWFDPEVIKEAEAFGKKLSIPESARMTTDIRAIPAR